jgi:hypothetical protein
LAGPQDPRGYDRAAATIQNDEKLLRAVYKNNWQTSQADDVNAFSQQLQFKTTADLQTRFCESLMARLYFRHMADRLQIIPQAHIDTFEWMFSEEHETGGLTSSDNFNTWLQRDKSSIYWIAGKPGSGKSTLMKFLYNHNKLAPSLTAWAGSRDLIKAGFYFWNSGSAIQMSRLGLFQTLLHTCLQFDADLIVSTFSERWEQFKAFGGGRDPVDWPELKRAFERLVSDQSRRFFFLIDGLDEFGGEPKDIIELILSIARPNVKICVASRPWLPFEDAFKKRPSLLLEHLTRHDISTYVTACFCTNEHYIRLQCDEPTQALMLLEGIVGKASGVFLWVRLVVESLLGGLSNADRMSDLQARLNALPSDLEALFDNLLNRLEPQYFTQACEFFCLLRTYRQTEPLEGISYHAPQRNFGTPSLLAMYFADDENTMSSLEAPWAFLEMSDALRKAEHMRRRLIARCRGFLETWTPNGERPFFDHEITYLHRTARDYIESDDYWEKVQQTVGYEAFKSEERWANANLWVHKAHPFINVHQRSQDYNFELFMIKCLKSAMVLQEKTGTVAKTYLDEVFRVTPNRDYPNRCGDAIGLALEFLKTVPKLTDYLEILFETANVEDRRRLDQSDWQHGKNIRFGKPVQPLAGSYDKATRLNKRVKRLAVAQNGAKSKEKPRPRSLSMVDYYSGTVFDPPPPLLLVQSLQSPTPSQQSLQPPTRPQDANAILHIMGYYKVRQSVQLLRRRLESR